MIAQSTTNISERSNFNHLVGDITWFGLALAATTRFLSVYAIRLGASAVDLGWISSLPALTVLISSAFGAWWTRRYRDPARSLFWPGLGMRLLFLLPAFAPFLPLRWQPLWLILSISIPAIPQGPASVAFLVMMRGAINPNRMTSLLSRRQLMLNVSIAIGAVVFGVWLEEAPFPLNYQVMFLAAFALSLVSLYHCVSVRDSAPLEQPVVKKRKINPWRVPGFQRVAFVTAVMHIAFTSITSVTTLYLVNNMGADEGYMAVFALVELTAGALGSMIAPHLARRLGNRSMIAVCMAGTALNAIIIAFAPNLTVALFAALFSGACWTAGAGIGLFSFFVENTDADHMTEYSTAFNQMIGLALFIGPMIGSLMANSGMNLVWVLLFGALLRLLAAPLVESSFFKRRIHRQAVPHAL